MSGDEDYGQGGSALARAAVMALAAAYLLFEANFNAELLNTVGTLASHGAISELEFHGRLVSSCGFGLLLLSRIAHSRSRRRAGALALMVVAVAGLAMPAFFFGERTLINTLARHASTATRERAMDLAIAREALARGVLRIRDLPYHAASPGPADKTFLAMSGLLIYGDAPFMRIVSAHRGALLARLERQSGEDGAARAWHRYHAAERRVRALYARYRRASDRAEKGGSTAGASAAWAHLYQQLSDRYARYRREEKSIRKRARRQTPAAQKDLTRYFNARQSCGGDTSCLSRLNGHYRTVLHHFGATYVPWTYWCDNRGGGHWSCDLRAGTVRYRLFDLMRRAFKRRSGLDWGLHFADFLKAGPVVSGTRKRLGQRGLRLPAGWRLSQRHAFERAWRAAERRGAREALAHFSHRLLGQALRPGLSLAAFERLPALRKRLDASSGHLPPAGMSHPEFDRYLRRHADKRRTLALRRMDAERGALGYGQAHALDGRHYVQDMLVPPIALALSLLFGLLNAANLALELATTPFARRARRRIRFHGMALAIVAIVAVPLLAGNAIVESPAWRAALAGARKRDPALAAGLVWVMRAEPLVYPVAERVGGWLTPYLPRGRS